MKNHNTISSTSYRDATLEHFIQSEHKEAMAQSGHLAKKYAIRGKSISASDSLSVITHPIHAVYNSLLSHVESVLQGKLQLRTGSSDKLEVQNENTRLKKELIDKETEIGRMDTVQGNSFISVIIRLAFAAILICLIVGAEWQFLARALQVIAKNRASAQLLGLGIALSMPVILHFGLYLINKHIPQLVVRRLYRLGIVLVVVLAFIALGYIRMQFQNIENRGQSFSVFQFVAVNVFLNLAATFVVEVLVAPIIPQIRSSINSWLYKRKVDKLIAEKKHIENQIKTNNQNLLSTLKHKTEIVAYQKSLENQIGAYYEQSIAEFKKVYMLEREDCGVPDCFKDTLPDLSYHTPEIHL